MKTLARINGPEERLRRSNTQSAWRRLLRAFSLIEIMAVVGLMSVIIIGLMAMFNQTQRAFRLGMAQTDVLEAGRMATDLLVRELEQMRPAYVNWQSNEPNFYAGVMKFGSQPMSVGTTASRTNQLDDMFFITRENLTLTGIGYFVRTNVTTPNSIAQVGSLYRYETNQSLAQFQNNLNGMFYGFNAARNGNPTNVSKILDGIVHFRVRAYNPTNAWIAYYEGNPAYYYNDGNLDTRYYWYGSGSNLISAPPPPTGLSGVGQYYFYTNAVPAFVEVELGVLEPQAYERYKSIPVLTAQSNFLAQQAAHVHLFRQRIRIRNVDRSVYQ